MVAEDVSSRLRCVGAVFRPGVRHGSNRLGPTALRAIETAADAAGQPARA
ncbi:hypothetical protein ACIBSV_11885 [Embleya sp. NPDC050154]